jgi:hypothetical protein
VGDATRWLESARHLSRLRERQATDALARWIVDRLRRRFARQETLRRLRRPDRSHERQGPTHGGRNDCKRDRRAMVTWWAPPELLELAALGRLAQLLGLERSSGREAVAAPRSGPVRALVSRRQEARPRCAHQGKRRRSLHRRRGWVRASPTHEHARPRTARGLVSRWKNDSLHSLPRERLHRDRRDQGRRQQGPNARDRARRRGWGRRVVARRHEDPLHEPTGSLRPVLRHERRRSAQAQRVPQYLRRHRNELALTTVARATIGFTPLCAPHASQDAWRDHVDDSPTGQLPMTGSTSVTARFSAKPKPKCRKGQTSTKKRPCARKQLAKSP